MYAFRTNLMLVLCLAIFRAGLASGAPAGVVDENTTRYLAMGDSVPAGQGAVPQTTNGYVYRLYRHGAFDKFTNTIMSNSALVGGVLSRDVLDYQVPQAMIFQPDFVTLGVGGNDLGTVLGGAPPAAVLLEFQDNLTDIVASLCALDSLPSIFVANQYSVPELVDPVPGGRELLGAFNSIIEQIVNFFAVGGCDINAVDVFSAFGGFDVRHGLLLNDRPNVAPTEVHPTNLGHATIAWAFRKVIWSH